MRCIKMSGRAATVAAVTLTAGCLMTLVFSDVRGAAPASRPATPPMPPAQGTGNPTSQPALPPGHPGMGAPGATGMPSGHPSSKPKTAVIGAPGRPIERKPTPVKLVRVRAYHRVFHDFVEEQIIPMYKEFDVGDTDYTGEIVEYIPDFAMNLETHAIFTRSQEPKNPALRILVKQKGVPQDTTWALLNMPPHFAKKSLLAFKIMRLEIKGYKPIVAPDTTATGAPAPGAQKS